jgi:intergrase/recombinase
MLLNMAMCSYVNTPGLGVGYSMRELLRHHRIMAIIVRNILQLMQQIAVASGLRFENILQLMQQIDVASGLRSENILQLMQQIDVASGLRFENILQSMQQIDVASGL